MEAKSRVAGIKYEDEGWAGYQMWPDFTERDVGGGDARWELDGAASACPDVREAIAKRSALELRP